MLSFYHRLLTRLRNRLRQALAEEVSDENEFCVFHCRETHCTQAHWVQCPRRRQHLKPSP